MLNLTTRAKQFAQFGLTLGLGATLLLASTAGATSSYKCDEYKQVYAQTDYAADPHQHLDVVCQEGYRAISCEAAIAGKNDYDYSTHFVALNEAHPSEFNKNSYGKYEHASNHAQYYGCHFRANNFLAYFTPSYHVQSAYDFEWRLKGFATCVPEQCVYVEQTHAYTPDYDAPFDF
jgi:hypothetical protein